MSETVLTQGWVLHGAGRDFGPLSEEDLRGYFRAGMVRSIDRITAPGEATARDAIDVARELGETVPPGPPPPPAPAIGPVAPATIPADAQKLEAMAAVRVQLAAAVEPPRSRVGVLLVLLAIVSATWIGMEMVRRTWPADGYVAKPVPAAPEIPRNQTMIDYHHNFDIAEALARAEDWPALARHAQAWHRAQPQFPEALRFAVIAYSEQELWDQAIAASRGEIALNPRDPRVARNLLATALAQSGRDAEALVVLEELLAEDDRDAAVLNTYGVVLHRLQRHDAERLALEKAVRANPDEQLAWKNLERAYRELGDKTRAAEAGKRASSLPSEN